MNKLKLLPVILCLVLAVFGNSLTAKTLINEGNGTPSIYTEATSVVANPSEMNLGCTIQVPPTITANGPTTICAGGHVHLSTGNYAHYHWNTGANSQSINAFFTGNYRVTVTNNQGCTGVASIQVTVHPSPHPIIHLHGPFTWCSGHVTLDAGAGYSSYSWSNGANTQMTTANNIGFYSCTVTNQFGCTGVAYRFVIALPNPTVSISQTGNLTCANSGSVNLTANGGFGVTGYTWDNSSTNPNMTVTTAGTYCVTVNSFWGCTATACHTVTGGNNSISCSITPSGSTTFCSGGSVGLDAGSFASYIWSTGDVTESVTAAASGTYSVTVTDANGCTCISAIDVTVNASPNPTLTYSSPPIFCNGGNVTLDAGTWASYLWSTGDQVETITLSNGGNYCATVTDGNGCTGVACQQVTVNPVPNPTITASGPTTFCDGGSVTLDAGTWDNYSWSPNGEISEAITASSTGTYCVVITDSDGCTGMACVDVTDNANPSPIVVIDALNNSICDGSSAAIGYYDAITNIISGGSPVWSTGSTDPIIFATTSGNYCVTVTDNNGCVGVGCATLIVNANPTPTISGNTSFCDGSSTILDAGTWAAYNWVGGSTDESVFINASDTYCVTVTDDNGCQGSTCVNVIVNNNPTPSISGNTSTCQGNSVTLDAGSWNAYSWSDGDATETTSVNTSGNVSVTVTDGNGCMGSASTTVTINPLPTVTAGDVIGCAGTNISLLGSPAGGTWSVPNPYNNVAGTYSYTYSYTDGNGCSNQATSNITVNGNPTPSISGPASACNGTSTTLSAGQWASYSWSTGSNNSAIIVNQTGNYCVTVTDGNGCMGSVCQQYTNNANPTPVISGPTAICAGGAANLTVGAYATYHWSNGSNNSVISATVAGNYCVTVSNSNGCVGTACTTISVSSNPVPSITGPTTNCQGGTVTLTTGSFTTYSWSNGATTQSIAVTTTGTYYVTVSNAAGCTGVAHQSVTVGTAPVPVINPSGPTTFCNGSSVNLNVINTYATYVWSNGAVTQSYGSPITASGVYSVTVSYTTGCTGSTSITVTVNSFVTPTITPGQVPAACTATSMVLSANAGFTTYAWSSGQTVQNINISAPGTYTVSVSNSNGCNGQASYTTSSNFCPKPTPVMTANPGFNSCTGNPTLDAGAGFASYAWSNGGVNETTVATTAGNYIVTVSTACGCTATASHVVQIYAGPNTNLTATGLATYCSNSGNVTLTAQAGYNYLWSTGAVTNSISVAPGNPGNYCVTITTINGCTGVACELLSNSCIVPSNLGTSQITVNSAYASWVQPACVAGYTIVLTDLTTSTVHGTYTFAPNSHYTFSGLTHAHNYSWTIQTNCTANGSVNSGPSAPQFFSAARIEAGDANNNTISGLNVYPNPANDHATVVFSSDNTNDYTLKLVDITGRTILSEVHSSAIGDNQVELGLTNIAKGLYFINIETNDQKLVTKIMVQ